MHTNARVAQSTSPEIPATSGLSSEHLRASGKGKFIWAGEENRILYYNCNGERVAETKLSEAPDPTALAVAA